MEQSLTARPLSEHSWAAYADLIERHGGDRAVGWCQFGPDDELDPDRKFRRHYWPGLTDLPRWRVTCFFVDRKYRGQGISSLALDGALQMIREQGGGVVKAYPEAVEGRKMNIRFVYLGTVPMFEKRGFEKIRLVAKHHWVMRTTLSA